ncbi:MAG: DNA starvation/stationary phase protection protein Dps, partial [Leptolyngbya sp. SIO3F4]|nr:DNA starvation/stationary phase protection protein Dps [Leptolyngbya sp. SIO3F4]
IKQAIWYMRGETFYQFYRLFNEIAAQIEEKIDAIALRISALASTPLVSIRSVAQHSQLPAYSFEIVPRDENLKALIDRVSFYGRAVRLGIEQAADLEDADTVDLYTEISRTVDKHLWLLESHLLPQ